MKCSICNNEMEQGFLQGMRRVAWVKNQHKASLLPKQGEILLKIIHLKILFFQRGFVKITKVLSLIIRIKMLKRDNFCQAMGIIL